MDAAALTEVCLKYDRGIINNALPIHKTHSDLRTALCGNIVVEITAVRSVLVPGLLK